MFQTNGQYKEIDSQKSVKVMTYNVRTFNYRLWDGWEENAKSIGYTINTEDPDILCLQEYYDYKGMPRFNYRYKHSKLNSSNFGLAIFSKYKIINRGSVEFNVDGGGYKAFIYADLLINKKDTIRVINAHLKSIGLDKANLSHLKDSDISQAEIEEQKKKLIRPLLDAYKIRGSQAKTLSDFIKETDLPIIFCGDLNDPPGSYTYHTISSELIDTFVKSGSGFSTSVPMFNKYHLPLRIDYIMCDEKFTPFNYNVIRKDHSDHFPITVDLEFP
ncbi:MAG: endonuclease/exonuclease/phosphatase family protein [Schleiferiaceae bacterium]|nr:endonuclease/exonuclease/phosphatase family protein [Schleiferiaceae bacterium]